MRSYRKGDPWINFWDVSASAIPRALLPSALSALLCGALEVSPKAQSELAGLIEDSYAFQVRRRGGSPGCVGCGRAGWTRGFAG
eukprot:scaffold189849_cov29-Tisochrysis_lutea.AAC.1